MARATHVVTSSWVEVAQGSAVISIVEQGRSGPLLFNETASDINAHLSNPDKDGQYEQAETIPTFVRSDGEGWSILIDGDTNL